MLNKDTKKLFDYLKDILYMSECEKLDSGDLSAEYKELCEGMNVLHDYVAEEREFAKRVTNGDLDYINPTQENQLCWGLKSLQTEIKTFQYQLKAACNGELVGLSKDNEGHFRFCSKVKSMSDEIKQKDLKISELETEIEKLKNK